jgi:hypothetical protein
MSYPSGVMPKPTDEYRRFEDAMRVLVRVPKTEVTRLLAEEKLANAGKPKRGPKPKASGRASGDKS